MEEIHSNHIKPKKKFSMMTLLRTIVILALVGGLAGLGYLYYQTRQELQFLSSQAGQEELAKKEVEQVVSALGKLAILPQEDPVVATITDYAALASQSAFYNNSMNGDKLVVYPQAKQAFIYSPSRNKIVNVGPLLIDDAPVGENGEGAEQAEVTPINIEVRNGSTTAGKGTTVSSELEALASNIVITDVTDAANTEYEGTLIVATSPEMANTANQIASRINAQVVNTLPSGEDVTQADILIIVGN